MRVVAEHARALVECLRRASSGAGVLVVEADVRVDTFADGLDARVSWRRTAEELPRGLRQHVGFTIAATEEEHEALVRQVLNEILLRREHGLIRQAGVIDDAAGREAETSSRSEDAVTLVSEGVAIRGDRQHRLRDGTVGHNDV